MGRNSHNRENRSSTVRVADVGSLGEDAKRQVARRERSNLLRDEIRELRAAAEIMYCELGICGR